MELFGLRTCDTCRKANKALAAAGHTVTFVDVRKDGVSVAQLATFLGAFGEALINRKSTTWRQLDDAERAMAPLELLQAHPALMKRPVISSGDDLTLGWGPETQEAFL